MKKTLTKVVALSLLGMNLAPVEILTALANESSSIVTSMDAYTVYENSQYGVVVKIPEEQTENIEKVEIEIITDREEIEKRLKGVPNAIQDSVFDLLIIRITDKDGNLVTKVNAEVTINSETDYSKLDKILFLTDDKTYKTLEFSNNNEIVEFTTKDLGEFALVFELEDKAAAERERDQNLSDIASILDEDTDDETLEDISSIHPEEPEPEKPERPEPEPEEPTDPVEPEEPEEPNIPDPTPEPEPEPQPEPDPTPEPQPEPEPEVEVEPIPEGYFESMEKALEWGSSNFPKASTNYQVFTAGSLADGTPYYGVNYFYDYDYKFSTLESAENYASNYKASNAQVHSYEVVEIIDSDGVTKYVVLTSLHLNPDETVVYNPNTPEYGFSSLDEAIAKAQEVKDGNSDIENYEVHTAIGKDGNAYFLLSFSYKTEETIDTELPVETENDLDVAEEMDDVIELEESEEVNIIDESDLSAEVEETTDTESLDETQDATDFEESKDTEETENVDSLVEQEIHDGFIENGFEYVGTEGEFSLYEKSFNETEESIIYEVESSQLIIETSAE